MYNAETLLRTYKRYKTFDRCAVRLGMKRKAFSKIWYEAGLPSPKSIPKHDIEPEVYKIAACSDMHFGSKQQALTPFLTFIQEVLDQNVRTLVIPGDICEGLMPRQGHEQVRFLHSIDEIYNYVYNIFAEFADQFENVFVINGNHCESLNRRANGFNLCSNLARDFNSVQYDDDPAELINPVTLDGGIKAILYHGNGGCAKNLVSRSRSKLIDYMNYSTDLDLFLLGHCHRFSSDFWLGKYCFNLGCFQSTTHFLADMGKVPQIRGEIIQYQIDTHGTMRKVIDIPYCYDEQVKKDDW